MPASFKECFDKLLIAEGGWKLTEDSNDPGGVTYGGMTYNTFVTWCKQKKHPEFPSVEGFKAACNEAVGQNALLKTMITLAYKELYWDKLGLINQSWGNWPVYLIFNCGVNLGIDDAIEIVQTMCGVAVDGKFGPVTNAKVQEKNRLDSNFLRDEFKRLWRMRYMNLVIKNLEAWEDYTEQLEALLEHQTPAGPATKRWKYLRGWINRVDNA